MRGLLAVGASVTCSDESFGELQGFVLDPLRPRVTNLVVLPKRHPGGSRLVSLGLVGGITPSAQILLNCRAASVWELPEVQQVSHFRVGDPPIVGSDWDVGVRQVMSMPFYDAGALIEYSPNADPEFLVIYDRIPKGQVEIGRGSLVSASDGPEVGRVTGVFVDNAEITQLAVERKHLGRRRTMTIPIEQVLELATDNVTLRFTKDQLHTPAALARR